MTAYLYLQSFMFSVLFRPSPFLDPKLPRNAETNTFNTAIKKCSLPIPASFYGLLWILVLVPMYVIAFNLSRRATGFVMGTIIIAFYLIFGLLNLFAIRAHLARQAKLTETADVR